MVAVKGWLEDGEHMRSDKQQEEEKMSRKVEPECKTYASVHQDGNKNYDLGLDNHLMSL